MRRPPRWMCLSRSRSDAVAADRHNLVERIVGLVRLGHDVGDIGRCANGLVTAGTAGVPLHGNRGRLAGAELLRGDRTEQLRRPCDDPDLRLRGPGGRAQ